MDPEVCREHLAEILTDEVGLLGELRALLERESEVLGTRDAVAVEKALIARQDRMSALTRLEEQRRALCSMHGFSADRIGLEHLMMWCDPEGSLVSRLRECAKGAAACRELNDRNGTLVNAKLRRVEGLLGALTGRPATPADTYSARGSTEPSRPGRVLGAA
jgi:flagellar biosynthesis protein FlgN